MGEFFGSVYCWFEDVFGLELANYLWGNLSPDQQTNMEGTEKVPIFKD